MNTKQLLKFFKINESSISMLLGAIVVIAIGFMVVNAFRTREKTQGTLPQPTATTQTPKPEEGKVPENLPKKHTVSKGEHLWGIAQRYYNSGYNWVDIAKANKITNPEKLAVGQELTLPSVSARKTTIGVQSIQKQTIFGPPIQEASYRVVKGDHLWGIAVRAYGDGFQWTKIAKVNKLKNPNLILPGQVLNLPREGVK